MGDAVIPIRVLVRVRPFNEREKKESAQECLQCYIQQNQIGINDKLFAFDSVFDPSCSQEDVYNASASMLLEKLFKGYNCTILAYGQTGSGKTYTMGTEETTDSMLSDSRGIVPRIVDGIFAEISSSDSPELFNVNVSMLEIYDEKVHDLLSGTREPLQIREIKEKSITNVFVQGLSVTKVTGLARTMSELERGCQLRSKGETAMNEKSSRSHAIFTLILEKLAQNEEDSSFKAKLHLVDLAGSERLKKTQAEGERMKEGIRINEGLHALGKVIQALSQRESHIPYRDSKITRLLQDSLGGNSYTAMIACVSPADSNCEETLSTLRYADRVKQIKNKPTVNVDPTTLTIQRYREEVERLRHELAQYKAGETPVDVPTDKFVKKYDLEMANARAADEQRKCEILSRKLTEAVVQKGTVQASLIKAMGEVERLQAVIDSVKAAISPENSASEAMMSVAEILELEKKEKEERHAEEAVIDTDTDEDADIDLTIDNNKFLARTESLNREVEDIMKEIEQKEQLVHATTREIGEYNKLEVAHKKQMEELQTTIKKILEEKEHLNEQLNKLSNSSKLAEERRRRLQEVEKELQVQRKKMNELKNIEKSKQRNDEMIKRLNADLAELKSLRVKMSKQLRSESEKYRVWKARYEKQISQMQLKERKRDNEVARAKTNMEHQLAVYRRRYEEASGCNKRLQAQLLRCNTARVEKINEGKINEQLKGYCENELNLVGNDHEAQLSIGDLKEERNMLAEQLRLTKEKLARIEGGEPPKKRRETEEGERDDEAVKQQLGEQINKLQEELELCTTEMHDLQSKRSNVDLETRAESRWASVHTVTHAKIALKQLFDLAQRERCLCIDKERTLDEKNKLIMEEKEKRQEVIDMANNQMNEEHSRYETFRTRVIDEKNTFMTKLNSLYTIVQNKGALTEEQMAVIAGLQEKLDTMYSSLEKKRQVKKKSSMKRSSKQDTLDPGNQIDGKRTRRTITRFGNMKNTLETVRVEEDMDQSKVDAEDTTFRPLTDAHKTSRRRPSPIKCDPSLSISRRESRLYAEPPLAGATPSTSDENDVQMNGTYVIEKEEKSEKMEEGGLPRSMLSDVNKKPTSPYSLGPLV